MEKEVWQPVTLIMQSAWKTKQKYLQMNIYKWEWLPMHKQKKWQKDK